MSRVEVLADVARSPSVISVDFLPDQERPFWRVAIFPGRRGGLVRELYVRARSSREAERLAGRISPDASLIVEEADSVPVCHVRERAGVLYLATFGQQEAQPIDRAAPSFDVLPARAARPVARSAAPRTASWWPVLAIVAAVVAAVSAPLAASNTLAGACLTLSGIALLAAAGLAIQGRRS